MCLGARLFGVCLTLTGYVKDDGFAVGMSEVGSRLYRYPSDVARQVMDFPFLL